MKYYHGDELLTNVHQDEKGKLVGNIPSNPPVFNRLTQRWDYNYVPVDRKIEYKSNPSKHPCDARCYNATGKIMKCECSCGGKNHGLGAWRAF